METNGVESSLESYNQEISDSTKKIVSEIKSLEKELEEIQNSCPHPTHSVKNCPSGAERSFNLKKVCDVCQIELGYPSQEEINKWASS